MEIPYPKNQGYTIYTKSNCLFCEKIKKLLENEIPSPQYINSDIYLEINKEEFIDFIKQLTKKEYRTFPMVFLDGEFLGGFRETKQYRDKNNVQWSDLEFA
jgi:glutaredoxin